jgi:hypothetical protein
MSKPVTNCEGCVFAECDDEQNQKGCSLQRPILLGVQSEDQYYLLDRFCNAYRPDSWVNDLEFSQQLMLTDTVLEEIRPKMGFFVVLDTSVKDAISDLKKTLDSIRETEGGDSYIIVVTDKVEYNEEIWELLNPFKEEFPESKYIVMQLTEAPENLVWTIDHAFSHARNGWIMCLTSGSTVPPKAVDSLHNFINIEMRQIIMVEPTSGINGLTFPAYLFKFLNGNKTKMFNDEMTDSRQFLEKVRDAEKRGGTKTIYEWHEVLGRLGEDNDSTS